MAEEVKVQLRPATQVVLVETGPNDPYNPASTPIYQTATFKQNSAVSCGEYDYTRSGNPTRTVLETHLAKLMGAHKAYVVSSGMSALDVITRLMRSGDEIIAGTDLYGGTNRLLKFLEGQKVVTRHVDTCDIRAVEAALSPATKMVLLESPTNPLIRVCDIKAICDMVHERNPDIKVVVDNTMMSPYLQRTLDLGADIEYHSGTKYLCGHHDVMAGVIACKSQATAEAIYFIINASGVGLAPFDCWLLLRGVKTLSVRIEKQQANAIRIADYLESKGLKVNFPGLKSHSSYELHSKQASGPGAVLSFETGSTLVSQQVVEGCKIFGISVSFGCVNSLISMPCRMSHASIPAHVRKERNMPEDLIRLCVGIEDPDDLIADLDQALRAADLI
eukprot:comp19256_c0_seq1/m.22051 comp19256_c0_seq1/g.22051  ORF comp19256_c0_seq1/g.22051 comp19256_c0_seq1/m.22051 type:complete len:390 (-) comp19256_c0_seq1:637-1806(-)